MVRGCLSLGPGVLSVEEEEVLPIVFSIATVFVGFVSVPHVLGLLSTGKQKKIN